jgi:hypothetical protein
MGSVQSAAISTGIGWLVDNVLGTRPLGTLIGLAHGLFKMDSKDMNGVYDKVRAFAGDAVKKYGGFEMPATLGGKSTNGTATPDLDRAKANAADAEKKTGVPWGKYLLYGGAAVLGLNVLDRVAGSVFSMGWYSPFMRPGMMPGMGFGPGMGLGPGMSYGMPFGGFRGGGILPIALLAMMGIRALRPAC